MTEPVKPRKSSGKSLHKTNPVRLPMGSSVVTVIPTRKSPPYLNGFPAPHVIAEPREQMDRKRKEKCALWTLKDKKTFTDQYIQHGKNFLKISEALGDKTLEDCIQHYYLTKHAMRYKKLKLEADKVNEPPIKRKKSVEKSPQKKRRHASKDNK